MLVTDEKRLLEAIVDGWMDEREDLLASLVLRAWAISCGPIVGDSRRESELDFTRILPFHPPPTLSGAK